MTRISLRMRRNVQRRARRTFAVHQAKRDQLLVSCAKWQGNCGETSKSLSRIYVSLIGRRESLPARYALSQRFQIAVVLADWRRQATHTAESFRARVKARRMPYDVAQKCAPEDLIGTVLFADQDAGCASFLAGRQVAVIRCFATIGRSGLRRALVRKFDHERRHARRTHRSGRKGGGRTTGTSHRSAADGSKAASRSLVSMLRAATTPCNEANRYFLMKRSANRASRGTIVGRSSRLS
ncbi:hypothetical protein QZM22_25440 [Burkholderia oklahomensis]|uniref:hypothetical protein n=1 Tax=Burkholderia oklahomensis TaxID=342113 RepID=UPI00264CA62E|nr:hypothetical protein [Burkholderia oklahomensis]MDN7675755.1 hypothetical protein [Burkholderia oklahomensis]